MDSDIDRWDQNIKDDPYLSSEFKNNSTLKEICSC